MDVFGLCVRRAIIGPSITDQSGRLGGEREGRLESEREVRLESEVSTLHGEFEILCLSSQLIGHPFKYEKITGRFSLWLPTSPCLSTAASFGTLSTYICIREEQFQCSELDKSVPSARDQTHMSRERNALNEPKGASLSSRQA